VLAAGTLSRNDLFLQTKFTSVGGQDLKQAVPYDVDAPVPIQVQQSVQKSLRNLGVEYIDSLVLHSPLETRKVSVCGEHPRGCAISVSALGHDVRGSTLHSGWVSGGGVEIAECLKRKRGDLFGLTSTGREGSHRL
jgi:aryl-alcohol dehydrogenase-like predicted oxidoreductase